MESPLGPRISIEVECSFSLFSLVVSPPSTMIRVELSFSRGQTWRQMGHSLIKWNLKWSDYQSFKTWLSRSPLARRRRRWPWRRRHTCPHQAASPWSGSEHGHGVKLCIVFCFLKAIYITLVPPPHVLLQRDQGAHSAHWHPFIWTSPGKSIYDNFFIISN